jgi:mxaJ protein
MFSAFLKPIGLVVVVAALAGCTRHDKTIVQATTRRTVTPIARPADVLRVCADPNNLPFSNDKLQGFEDRIAQLLANDLKQKVEYTWWAQRRGFIRNTLRAGKCDVVLGVPAGFEQTLNTRPYYRSSYVFVSRQASHLDLKSFDDEPLKKLKVGVQMIGDDFANTPPAQALSRRNIIQNVKGFTVYGDYSRPNPSARIVDAVAKKDIDVAVVWGPLAGYFANQQKSPLTITPVSPQFDQPSIPFVFDISMGVRREDQDLRDELDAFLLRRQGEIEKILQDYRVPLVK